ncbi:MAG: type II secretion system protein GspN [SAR324 cluster bacterium]|nr:type II secretion system protein GspN [SAR324 cluster bacterium]
MLNQLPLKKGIIVAVCLIVGIFFFMMGLQHTFPGQTIAQYMEQQLASQTSIQTKIAPVELNNISHLSIERVAVLAPPSEDITELFVLEHLKIDLFPEWLQNQLHVEAEAYGGKIESVLDMDTMKTLGVGAENVSLNLIPIVNLFPYAIFKGTLKKFFGSIRNVQELQSGKAQLPAGRIVVLLENLKVHLKNLDQLVPGGISVPDLSFSSITLDAEYDKLLTIRKMELKGSIEGSIEGQIALNHRNLQASTVKLHLKFTLSEEVQKALGPMTLILQGVQCGNVFDFDLTGTFRSLNPPKKRTCS